ncbi:MAG: ribonuclease HII [Methanoregula sp.]|nr:ribonuclease HII [Methanoregula sp.]
MICGVDEAGKGSVLGPMVIAGVAVASGDVFSDIPVKDSKELSPSERDRLFLLIREKCTFATVVIEAHEIDAIRREMTLNACVAKAHADVIRKLSPDTAYVDACDVNAFRYAETVKSFLPVPCEIVSEHHADQTYTVVSAASIIAKVTRDRLIAELAQKYGDIGSGYPADPITVTYLNSYIDEHGCPPPIARKSWKTVIAMMGKREQCNLSKFF